MKLIIINILHANDMILILTSWS